MLTIWIFGRDFSDHTVKDLLGLPTRRTTIVAAKFAVAAVWCLTLTGYLFVLGLVISAVLRLHGWSGPVAAQGLARFAGHRGDDSVTDGGVRASR